MDISVHLMDEHGKVFFFLDWTMSLGAVDMDNVDRPAVEGEQQPLSWPILGMPWARKGSATVRGRRGEEREVASIQ